MASSLPALSLSLLSLVLACIWYYSAHSPLKDLHTHLDNKVVLLCGASSGIGESLAYKLAAKRARLVLVARSEDKLRRVKERALEAGAAQVEYILYDFADVAGTKEVVDKTVALFGGVDYLVLNHGAMPGGFFLTGPQHSGFLERIFNINILSFIQLTVHALPHLEQANGHIFVTSSVFGFSPCFYAALYSSTKHAINGFFYSLQQELLAKQSGVSVTVGELGFILTEEMRETLKEELEQLPGAGKGDLEECTAGIRDALVTRPRTFSYPWASIKAGQLMWGFNPWYHEMLLQQQPFGRSYQEIDEELGKINEKRKEFGAQKGNLY